MESLSYIYDMVDMLSIGESAAQNKTWTEGSKKQKKTNE